LLVVVAQRLKAIVRESDAVARLGGDEFVVVLTDLAAPAVRPAALVAAKIVQELGHSYQILGHVVHSTPSIGIAVFPDDGADGALLMKNADAAMYHAKSAGRNNFQFFAQPMNDAAVARLELENGLRQAVARGEFQLHYQPQIDLASNEVVGVEALVRWRHPQLGLVAPLKFITLAEEIGLIVPIGEWVLGEALRQLAEWRRQGMAHLTVSVNISAHQLGVSEFVGMVLSKLAAQGLAASALRLEITESVAMQRPEQTVALLRELRRLGVGLAIDDFGTGYSSLSYLKQLPLNCLKLDRSFVSDIESDANDAAICAATISLAHNLGLAVVAEGVETAAQLSFLRSLGCDGVQGYFFSKPLPAPECAAFIESWLAVAA
jgi:predicted signal transduction protein with EAL and GGDEF domain